MTSPKKPRPTTRTAAPIPIKTARIEFPHAFIAKNIAVKQAIAAISSQTDFNFTALQQSLTPFIASCTMSSTSFEALLDRPIVLVGLMGVGKSSIGRRLADRLNLRFIDADDEIEKAAGKSIADIFADDGEAVFRDGERRVIARLINDSAKPIVLALGGGAFVNDETRALLKAQTLSIWLNASIDVLLERTSRKPGKRPLLDVDDPRSVLEQLTKERTPAYSQSDLTIMSDAESHDTTIENILTTLEIHLKKDPSSV
jgi:shikimate kinase